MSLLWLMRQHRYLMSRLSLQVFYLWRHVLPTTPPFLLWWSNLEILFAPLHRSSPFIGGLRCQAIQTEHGPQKEPKKQSTVYCDMSMMRQHNCCTSSTQSNSTTPVLPMGPIFGHMSFHYRSRYKTMKHVANCLLDLPWKILRSKTFLGTCFFLCEQHMSAKKWNCFNEYLIGTTYAPN
jgi:hypothetical protein